ncbi:pyocin knob domain-containing protein [Rodentibacter caecimuris]|uniref:pyocin knob domain-containing protein n=1 Tax=Rodentibacter caecimuris TaxID=1796644 RepID=UPI0013DCEFDF|nr:pyocin knob domain-containing protein [Rodentibacter heylii]
MRVPKLLSKAWASSGLKNDIPMDRSDSLPRESATYNDGFPQITMTPISMGGKAPSGKDMNGALNELSDHIVYQNKGGIYPFNAEFAEKIGGYPKGAILINERLNLAFQSLVDNNKTNFNTQDYTGKWVVVFGNDFFVPKTQTATTTQVGIVQLNSATNSNSETQASTPKAVKTVKDQLDSVQRNQANYIPNSKKSNAVNSASSDTVATSVAVKTAHDKAVEAKNAADNANNNANRRAFGLALSSEDLNSITASGIYGQSLNSNSTSARHYPIEQAGKLIVTGSSGFGAQQLYISYHDNHIYARGKNQNGWSDWKRIDGLNGVSKSGDTMTGNLVIDTDDSLLKGKRSGVNKYAVGLRNSTSNDVVVLNYTDNTSIELLANSVYSNKTLVAPGMILEDSDWTGLNIKNLSGRYVRFEGNPHSATNMLTIMYREANGTNINTVSLRKKGGTLALLEDFTYQKIGNFEVRRYPDGTMIQTYFAEFNDIFGANSGLGGSGQKQLTWAAAFVGKPIVFGNITTSLEENHNAGVNILTKSTNTTLYWYNYESGSANQRLCRLQFLAIGRWR